MEIEEWSLGPSKATAHRDDDRLIVRLRGMVTAAAYEALHARLASSTAAHTLLVIGDDAVLVATAKSLAEAAGRGTPANRSGPPHTVVIAVPRARLGWAFDHCALMSADGLCRVPALATRLELAGAAVSSA